MVQAESRIVNKNQGESQRVKESLRVKERQGELRSQVESMIVMIVNDSQGDSRIVKESMIVKDSRRVKESSRVKESHGQSGRFKRRVE